MSPETKQSTPNTREPVIEPTSCVPELFVDGISNASFQGGVVRLDFARLSASARGEEGQAALERNLRVICSVEGFMASYQTMQRLVEQLAAQGKIAVAPSPRVPVQPPT